ncbi:DUF397 domain-containing protein [Actinokineospora sp. HUAS TT18]|uniref:DUF397 domain-containing protein n=1 Tax=Actinokineospora sp. HUAS TT18 TaxID=3447451 RepID=UPI003F528D75
MDAEWRKSSVSQAGGQDCVEVAYATQVRVRDSKNPDGGTLAFPADTWLPQHLASV